MILIRPAHHLDEQALFWFSHDDSRPRVAPFLPARFGIERQPRLHLLLVRMTLVAALFQERLDLGSEELIRVRQRCREEDCKGQRAFHARSLLSISPAAFTTSPATDANMLFGIRPAIPETQSVATSTLSRSRMGAATQ